jgi:hypothetical protein
MGEKIFSKMGMNFPGAQLVQTPLLSYWPCGHAMQILWLVSAILPESHSVQLPVMSGFMNPMGQSAQLPADSYLPIGQKIQSDVPAPFPIRQPVHPAEPGILLSFAAQMEQFVLPVSG